MRRPACAAAAAATGWPAGRCGAEVWFVNIQSKGVRTGFINPEPSRSLWNLEWNPAGETGAASSHLRRGGGDSHGVAGAEVEAEDPPVEEEGAGWE